MSMNVEQRRMFYDRLKDNVLEVHYTSDKDTYHEIECTLEDPTLWDETKDEITVWNVIDQNSRKITLARINTLKLSRNSINRTLNCSTRW